MKIALSIHITYYNNVRVSVIIAPKFFVCFSLYNTSSFYIILNTIKSESFKWKVLFVIILLSINRLNFLFQFYIHISSFSMHFRFSYPSRLAFGFYLNPIHSFPIYVFSLLYILLIYIKGIVLLFTFNLYLKIKLQLISNFLQQIINESSQSLLCLSAILFSNLKNSSMYPLYDQSFHLFELRDNRFSQA